MITYHSKQESIDILAKNIELYYKNMQLQEFFIQLINKNLTAKQCQEIDMKIGVSPYSLTFLNTPPTILKMALSTDIDLNYLKEKMAAFQKNIKIPIDVEMYIEKLKQSIHPVAGTTEIKETGAIATIDDVLNDPVEPIVWKSYIQSLPIIAGNDPNYNFTRIVMELNLLSSIKIRCMNTSSFDAPAAVTIVSPDDLVSSKTSVDLNNNYLLYNPETLIPLITTPFNCDMNNHLDNIEHLLVTILLHEARHIFRGDLLNTHGYDPSSSKNDEKLTKIFNADPSKTCYNFPFDSSGVLDNILADMNINMSLEHDLTPSVAFGGSDTAKHSIVHMQNPNVALGLKTIDNSITNNPKLQPELSQLSANPKYTTPHNYFVDTDILLLKQKLLWCKTYTANRNNPLKSKVQQMMTKQQSKNANPSNNSQQTGSNPAKPQKNKGLTNGDITNINQKKITKMKDGDSHDQTAVDDAKRKNVALAQEAQRQAEVEFPNIDFDKIGGRLRQIKTELEKTRPLPTFQFKLKSVNRSLQKTSKIEWQRRHFVYPDRLDIAHISKKKMPAANIVAYFDISGSITSNLLKRMFSVLRATVEDQQSLTIKLFAQNLGEPIYFKASDKKQFKQDFDKLLDTQHRITGFGTDLMPVFDDIIDTPNDIHIIISDFCCDLRDFKSRQKRLDGSVMVFVNTYDQHSVPKYKNIVTNLNSYVRNHKSKTKMLYLPDYSV